MTTAIVYSRQNDAGSRTLFLSLRKYIDCFLLESKVLYRGAGSEVWNQVYMIAPVKKFGRVRLSINFPRKQIWRRMQTWKGDEFLLGFKFLRPQTSRKGFHKPL